MHFGEDAEVCWSCGCLAPNESHGDTRNLTTLHMRSAAEAAGVTVPEAVGNIARTLALHRGRQRSAQKSEGDVVAGCQVLKADSERRYSLGLAYPANRPDVSRAMDGFRDFAREGTLEEAAWSFLGKSSTVGLHHKDGTEGHGTVVESYLYRGPDWHLRAIDGSEQVIKAGDWLLGVIWDIPTFEAIKRGEFDGFSPQGRARRRQATPEAIATLRSR